MKATAKAYANIALVKYWGKQDDGLRLPTNPSVAIGLDKIYSITTVEFDKKYREDVVAMDGDTFDEKEKERVSEHLDRVRRLAGIDLRARVVTKNNFPKAVGAASSASGFAALSVAGVVAAQLDLEDKDLSILARQGSGSAARSISGGISIWHAGTTSEESFAEGIGYPKNWNLRVLLAFVGDMKQKKIGSTEAMALTKETSPYYQEGVRQAFINTDKLRKALLKGDFSGMGKVIEDECYRLHVLCMTTKPNILYWSRETVDIFHKLYELREEGVEGYFTVDAGPHVHIVCRKQDVKKIEERIKEVDGVREVVDCGVGAGVKILQEHLF